jgi:hypothetical protein
VQQGRGIGRRNHDRNAISTAPNAQLALHLSELAARRPGADGADAADAGPDPPAMVDWVHTALADGDLIMDKIRGDGTIDRATWSYNQGSMLGAHVLLARRAGNTPVADQHRDLAEAIARRSLGALADRLDAQPAAFHAIWFRNLLLLADLSCDEALRADILQTLRAYAQRCWEAHRQPGDLFLPPAARGRLTLLDQSAFVQVLALLAWPPESWAHLA